MSNLYYSLPLNLGAVRQQKELARVSLSESIAGWIHLIAVTRFGECRHDEELGCQIWEHDFENISNSQKFKDDLARSINETISKQEPRLTGTKTEVQLEQIELYSQNRRIKVRINLKVKGTIAATNEPFVYTENFFVGPLSYA